MKTDTKKLLLLLTLPVMLASCGGPSVDPNVEQVSIMAYNGGYGTDWLESICDAFTKETGIIATPTYDSTILNKIESQLTGVCEYDVFMSHGLGWQTFAKRDLLLPLDDLYATEVSPGVTFEQRVLPVALDHVKYVNKAGEEHYFKVPFTQGVGGFVYNMKMFSEHHWEVPNTYDDLVALCAQISSEGIKPFAWSGARDYYWDYPIYEWWCELEGREGYEAWQDLKDDSGHYANGYENFNPETKFKNFTKAFKMWYDLVGVHPEYANDKAYNASLLIAQREFFQGRAAMIPYAHWCKKEIEKAMKAEFSFDIAMMPTPKVKAETPKNINFMVGFGDSIIVPKKARHAENAKRFIAFLAKEESCKTFVEKADGPFFGFDYSGFDLSSLTEGNTYVSSLHNILTSSENISTDNNNPILINNGDTFIQPWVNNTRYYKDVVAGVETASPEEIIQKVYESARESWPGWCRTAGVE